MMRRKTIDHWIVIRKYLVCDVIGECPFIPTRYPTTLNSHGENTYMRLPLATKMKKINLSNEKLRLNYFQLFLCTICRTAFQLKKGDGLYFRISTPVATTDDGVIKILWRQMGRRTSHYTRYMYIYIAPLSRTLLYNLKKV